jgi:hypothetical protein
MKHYNGAKIISQLTGLPPQTRPAKDYTQTNFNNSGNG